MCEAFSPLLAHPELVVEAMTPCRGVGSAVGDAMVALTTLIHRGPGNCAPNSEANPNTEAPASSSLSPSSPASGTGGARRIRPPRRVLFFDVKPLYRNPETGQLEDGDRNLGDYNAEYQVRPFLSASDPILPILPILPVSLISLALTHSLLCVSQVHAAYLLSRAEQCGHLTAQQTNDVRAKYLALGHDLCEFEPPPEGDHDYNAMVVTKLKSLIRERNLGRSSGEQLALKGLKGDLIERLQADDEAATDTANGET